MKLQSTVNQEANPPSSNYLGAIAAYSASVVAVAVWFGFDEYVLGSSGIKFGHGGVAVFMCTLMAIANVSSFFWFPFFFGALDLGKEPHPVSAVTIGLSSGVVVVGLGTVALASTTEIDQLAVLFLGPVFLGLLFLAGAARWKDFRNRNSQHPESTH